MAWFKFLKKKLVLHCYTSRAEVFNYASIRKANSFLPDWWKELPLAKMSADGMAPTPTMKACNGIIDLYRVGFIMPMWSDLSLRIGEVGTQNYRYQYADGTSTIETHSSEQNGGRYLETAYQHLKLCSPWLFMCDEDITFLNTQPVWNFDTMGDVVVPPGAVEYKHQVVTNINMFVKRKPEVQNFIIPFGQPILHVVPLTDRKVELQTHLVTEEAFNRMFKLSARVSFLKKYSINKKILKERGCPFQHKVEW